MTTYTTDGSTIQTVTILTPGTYGIIVDGAQGGTGDTVLRNNTGGDGASVSGDIYLQAGTKLELVVGTEGSNSPHYGSGGGGGSFVIEIFNGAKMVDTILAVAGGGGGGGYDIGATGEAGKAGSSGGAGGGPSDGAGGSPGHAGSGGEGGGGGGGFTGGNGGGITGHGSPGSVGGTTFQGGAAYATGGQGGFGGGGGGGFYGGGGGGGYGGGGGGGRLANSGGGGGGSYLDASLTDQVKQAGAHAGEGSISITPLCYLRGTHILTPAGEVPVEDLRIGDTVCTLGQGPQPIRWIGTGTLMVPAGHRSPATPVIVRRDALAPGVPHRDLHITKGHALYLEGVLIPAEFLVNHRSILWNDTAREVEYYHIELDQHDVLLAEGAPAESYRDEGNRWMFRNANPAWDQPDVTPFAPVLTGGPQVDAHHRARPAPAGGRRAYRWRADRGWGLRFPPARGCRLNNDRLPRRGAGRARPLPRPAAPRRRHQPRRALLRRRRPPGPARRHPHRPRLPRLRTTGTLHLDDGQALLPPAATAAAPERLRLHLRHTTHYPAPVRLAA